MKNNHSVDVSLLFFSGAFFIILLGLFSKLAFRKNNTSFSPTPSPQQKITKPLKQLNYNLPIICDYREKDASISAAIEASTITATVLNKKGTQKYIVQGDCLYSWNVGESTGKKQWGVGNYIAMGKQLLSSGLSAESLTSLLKQTGKTVSIDLGTFFESCKNGRGGEKGVFDLPKGVRFE